MLTQIFGIFGVDLLFKLNRTKTGQKQILNSSPRVRGIAIHHQIIMQTCYVSFKFLLFPDEDAQVGSMLELNLLLFLT